jgi:hypothetical protein
MIPSLLAGASAVVVIIASRRQGWGWAAPMNLYVVAWALGIVIYSVRLFPFYDLSLTTWLLVALAGAAFIVAAFYGGRLRTGRMAHMAANDNHEPPVWLLRSFLLLGLAGFAVFLWHVRQAVGLSTFLQHPMRVHNALTYRLIPSSHLFLYYVGVAATILYGYWLLARKWRPRACDLVLLALFLLAMALSTERNHFLWCLASWMFCYFLPPAGDRSLLRILSGGTIAAAIGVTFYLAVGAWLTKSPDNINDALVLTVQREQLRRHLPLSPEVLEPMQLLLRGGGLHRFAVLYMALGGTLPALDQAMTSPERTYGALTFRPAMRLLARAGLVSDAMRGTTYEEVPTPYPSNAYTFLYEYYRDFGWTGALIFPALLGFLVGYGYRAASSGAGTVWPVQLTQLQAMILWTPFQNRFVLTVSWYLCALLLIACLSGTFRASLRRLAARRHQSPTGHAWPLPERSEDPVERRPAGAGDVKDRR